LTVTDGYTLIIDDGNEPQTVTFYGAVGHADILTQINAVVGAAAGGDTVATMTGGNFLALTNLSLGVTSIMAVTGGTAVAALGLTAAVTAGRVRGNPFAPLPGDVLWVDGIQYGTITQVAPGGATNVLKISTQVAISTNVGTAWYIVAMGLSPTAANAGVTRPYPNLIVNSGTGGFEVVPEVVRNTQGNPIYPASPQLYVQYAALRLDVTPSAVNAGAGCPFRDDRGLHGCRYIPRGLRGVRHRAAHARPYGRRGVPDARRHHE
jgi:hypothetical protein